MLKNATKIKDFEEFWPPEAKQCNKNNAFSDSTIICTSKNNYFKNCIFGKGCIYNYLREPDFMCAYKITISRNVIFGKGCIYNYLREADFICAYKNHYFEKCQF